jgi:hypothetical protein
MIEIGVPLAGQVERMVTVGLIAYTCWTAIYCPGFVSIPDSPSSLSDSEFSLKSLA